MVVPCKIVTMHHGSETVIDFQFQGIPGVNAKAGFRYFPFHECNIEQNSSLPGTDSPNTENPRTHTSIGKEHCVGEKALTRAAGSEGDAVPVFSLWIISFVFIMKNDIQIIIGQLFRGPILLEFRKTDMILFPVLEERR